MGRNRLILPLVVALVLVLAGCQPLTPAPRIPAVPVPALALHKMGETFDVHGINYYATARPVAAGTIVFVVRLTNTTDSTIAVNPRIEPIIYGSDATVREITQGSSESSGVAPPSQPEGVPSQTAALAPGGTLFFNYSVVPEQGDTGLVVGLTVQPGLEIRWLAP